MMSTGIFYSQKPGSMTDPLCLSKSSKVLMPAPNALFGDPRGDIDSKTRRFTGRFSCFSGLKADR